jgi:hypothetical protein
LALLLHIWNVRLCEAFYLPRQFVEVAFRNAIARALAERFGDRGHQHEPFRAILTARLRLELDKALEAARHKQHGDLGTHVIVSLTFGFWVHLLTKAFDFTLWKAGIARSFPNAPATAKLPDLHELVDRCRSSGTASRITGLSSTSGRWRNTPTWSP